MFLHDPESLQEARLVRVFCFLVCLGASVQHEHLGVRLGVCLSSIKNVPLKMAFRTPNRLQHGSYSDTTFRLQV